MPGTNNNANNLGEYRVIDTPELARLREQLRETIQGTVNNHFHMTPTGSTTPMLTGTANEVVREDFTHPVAEEVPPPEEPPVVDDEFVVYDSGGTGATMRAENVASMYTSSQYWGEPALVRTPTYRCNGCEQEIEGYGYVSVRSQNVEICEPCSAQMFRWMVSRSKSAILNG